MAAKGDSGFFIQPKSCQGFKDITELHSVYGEDSTLGVPQEFFSHNGRVLASSNGLVCGRNLNNRQPELFICNPATQTWLSIPVPESLRSYTDCDLNIVFECNDIALPSEFSHDSYTLMAMDLEAPEDFSNSKFKIYSYREGTWKEMGQMVTGFREMEFDMPVCYNGTINYISDCSPYLKKGSSFYWPYVVSYDIQSGKSKFLAIPKSARKGVHDWSCKLCIFKWRSGTNTSICLIQLLKGTFSAWVWSGDSDTSSWTRIMKIRVGAMGMMESDLTVAGFTVVNGSSLLIATAQKVYSYDLRGERHQRAKEICHHGCRENVLFQSYSNTLRPCGNIGATTLSI
ncbi:uncharacterized protein LOC132270177 [Cornus florida]|uniref:uncharacterized protein LOC132270177 n=1 Tax=Cornus florida TaxID=4283 RepID=UPI00289E77D7|nr:uncharacterized protein LOC132270177 [Cornus florida]